MFKPKLDSTSALAGYNQNFDGLKLHEITDLAIVSIAIPLGAETSFREAIKKAYNVTSPEPGKSAVSDLTETRLIGLARDHLFALFQRAAPDADSFVAEKIKSELYTTDQTDGWVALELSGRNARVALERICPIDLHPTQFEVGDIARTSMEHLGTLIIRTEQETYLLLSASSSALSFLHAIETSIKNIS